MLKRFLGWLFPPSPPSSGWPDPDLHSYDRPILPSLVLLVIVVVVFALVLALVFPA